MTDMLLALPHPATRKYEPRTTQSFSSMSLPRLQLIGSHSSPTMHIEQDCSMHCNISKCRGQNFSHSHLKFAQINQFSSNKVELEQLFLRVSACYVVDSNDTKRNEMILETKRNAIFPFLVHL